MKNGKPTQEPSHNQNISEWTDHFLPPSHFVGSFLESLTDLTEGSKSNQSNEFGSNVSLRDRSNLFYSFTFIPPWSKSTLSDFTSGLPQACCCHDCSLLCAHRSFFFLSKWQQGGAFLRILFTLWMWLITQQQCSDMIWSTINKCSCSQRISTAAPASVTNKQTNKQMN